MRAFIALSLPDWVRHELASAASAVSGHGAKTVSRENMHVTLQFFADLRELDIPAMDACLKKFADAWDNESVLAPRFEVRRGPNSMLWLAMDLKPVQMQAIQSLQAMIAARGYQVDVRPFRAHVTVARFGREARVRPADLAAMIVPPPFRFELVELVQSVLGPAGPKYTVLHSVQLPVKG